MSDMSPIPAEGYVQLELILDVDSLTLTGIEYMESAFDGWERNPGNPDVIMIEGAGQIAGEVYDQASDMPPEAVMKIGTSIYNIQTLDGVEATAQATFTFDDQAMPGLIDSGSPVTVPSPSSESVLFTTIDDIAVSANTVVVTSLIADAPGVAANGCYGPGELVDPVQGLDSIVVEESSGGQDAETAQEYLDRFSTILTTLSPRPILPQDHARLVANNVQGVGRATAIDLMVPGTGPAPGGVPDAIRDPNEINYFAPSAPPVNNTSNTPRCTTVAVMPDGGQPISAPEMQDLKQRAWDYLDANREVNFLNYVIGPTWTTIEVKGNVKPWPGQTNQSAVDSAVASLQQWLNPLTFGSTEQVGTQTTDWIYDTVVRHDEAVDYMNRGASVWYTANIQLRIAGGAWTAGDVVLPGLAPLPVAGDMSGVTAI